ncbi:MAG: cell division ATPase MinD [Candidatus Aenigmarchaeota archaeon]|nr:cell division ATPase MinD [Candidatus Aenigmarchaeota archaeon]
MENVEKIVGVVSGKGGVGKTTFVSNMGMALTEMAADITVVDADLSTSNLGLQLGLYQFPVGLQDALNGRMDVNNTIYMHPSGLRIIPSSVSLEYINQVINPYRLKNLLSGIEGIVMIDSPPGLGRDVSLVLKACDDVIVITNPEITAVTDAFKVVEVSRGMGKEPSGIVINRSRGKHELKPQEIEDMCGVKVVGIIPEDDTIRRSIYEKVPLVKYRPYSPASLAFRRLAAEMMGIEYRKPMFSTIKRILGVSG